MRLLRGDRLCLLLIPAPVPGQENDDHPRTGFSSATVCSRSRRGSALERAKPNLHFVAALRRFVEGLPGGYGDDRSTYSCGRQRHERRAHAMGRRDSQLSRRAERRRRQRRRSRRARDDVPRSRVAARCRRSVSSRHERSLLNGLKHHCFSVSPTTRRGNARMRRERSRPLPEPVQVAPPSATHECSTSSTAVTKRRSRARCSSSGSARSRRAPIDMRALARLHSCDCVSCARVPAPRPCSRLRSTPKAFRLLDGRRYVEAVAAFQRALDSQNEARDERASLALGRELRRVGTT